MIGSQLGPYRLDRELGSGGMGRVYAASVSKTAAGLPCGTRVALKIVHPHLLESGGYFKRFLQEAQIGRAVRHPNVVRTLDVDAFVQGGVQFHVLVMEFVEGQTLRALLDEMERVPEGLCRHVGRETAAGLAAIHAAGAVHRDLKPENVLITPDHQIKIMDLGVARLRDETVRLSRTGAIAGSLLYAAPEQFGSEGRADPRADLHALGVLLYELAAGVHPFLADDSAAVMHRIVHEEPPRLGDRNTQVSPFLEEVVHRLLEKDPERRFSSAAEVARVLEEGEGSPWWTERAKHLRRAAGRPLRRVRIPRETAVHGREAELAALRGLYSKAVAGEGQVVLLEGEAGVGKTRLVDEFAGRLQREGEDLSFLHGSYPPSGAATAAGALSTAYREQFGEEGSASWLARVPLLVPAFDALLRGDAPPPGAEPLTRESVASCFVHATAALAAERPTVILVDDLHFAPEEARGLFAALAAAAGSLRVLLVGAARPGLPGEWVSGLARMGHFTRMPLPRLGPRDVAALLEDAFRRDRFAEDLGFRILTRSDGNPFFVFEILRGLREGQFLARRDDGMWVTTRALEDLRIPESVLDLVSARVAGLSEEERDLLDVASCCGFSFDPVLAGEVAGLSPVDALRRFGHVERRHRLVRAVGRQFAFDHHQVQEALYGALSERLREEYHAALGDALERRQHPGGAGPAGTPGGACVDMCLHFLRGARGERALPYLDRALDHLEHGHMAEEAVSLAERALAVPALLQGRPRFDLVLRREGRLNLLGRRAGQEAALREAEALAAASGDPALRARAALASSRLHFQTNRYDEARARAESVLEHARAAGDSGIETEGLLILGQILSVRGAHAEARGFVERALAVARERGDRRQEAMTAGSLGNIHFRLGENGGAREMYGHSLRLAREAGDRRTEASAMTGLATLCSSMGEAGEALDLYRRSLVTAREIGDRVGEAVVLGSLGQQLVDLGDVEGGRALLEEGLALARTVGNRRVESYWLVALAGIAESWGAAEEALGRFEQALALARETGLRVIESRALAGMARVLGKGRRSAEARARRAEGLAVAEATGDDAERLLLGAEGALAGDVDPGAVLGLLAKSEPGLSARVDMEVRFLLWRATGERVHLAEAKRLLDHLVEHAPPECRGPMLTNVPLPREILDAWKDRGEPPPARAEARGPQSGR